jgi:hypothetical protein
MRRRAASATTSLAALGATAALAIGLAGCGASTPAAHSTDAHDTGTAVTTGALHARHTVISGRIVVVGGPMRPNGQQMKPHATSATAAAYRQIGKDGQPVGKPVATAVATAKHGGVFTLRVDRGVYYLVAQDARGHVLNAPTKVRADRASVSAVRLQIDVP